MRTHLHTRAAHTKKTETRAASHCNAALFPRWPPSAGRTGTLRALRAMPTLTPIHVSTSASSAPTMAACEREREREREGEEKMEMDACQPVSGKTRPGGDSSAPHVQSREKRGGQQRPWCAVGAALCGVEVEGEGGAGGKVQWRRAERVPGRVTVTTLILFPLSATIRRAENSGLACGRARQPVGLCGRCRAQRGAGSDHGRTDEDGSVPG